MNILLTNANSYKAVVVARFIKMHYPAVKVYGLVNKKIGLIFHSKIFDKVILKTNIHQILESEKIDQLIPVDSKEIGSWLKLKPELNKTLDYYSDFEEFEKLNDKLKFSKICEELRIPTPKSYFPQEVGKLSKGNYVFKPTQSSSSKGVKYFNDVEILKDYCKTYNSDFLVQEYFRGNGGGISFFSKNGEIGDYYLHKRLTEYPVSGGSSTMRAKFDSKLESQILEDARKLMKHINWSGFCMLEFKFNNNEYTFIEANPRIWGSINQGLVNGSNYFKEILGNPQVQIEKSNKITYQSPLVFASLLGYLLKGDLKNFSNIFRIIRSIPDINLFNDPKGYIGQFFV